MEIANIPLNFKIFHDTDDTPITRPSIEISTIGHGLINDTYVVNVSTETDNNDGDLTTRKYILQRINTDVFKHIDRLMSNIKKVSKHLQAKIHGENNASEPINSGTIRHCLVLVYTNKNKSFWQDDASGECWRMYHYLPNSITYTTSPGEQYLYEAGKAYGRFLFDLSDFPLSQSTAANDVEDLYETIPDFHNTPKRLETLRTAVHDDPHDRARHVRTEIYLVESHAHISDAVFSRLANGRLPKRTVHNDTKLENVPFDAATGRALCVVDYNTVMPNGCSCQMFSRRWGAQIIYR